MKCNMGIADRIIRIVLAIVMIVLASTVVNPLWAQIVLYVFGGIFILTSIFASCPLYIPLGIVTKCSSNNGCKKEDESKTAE